MALCLGVASLAWIAPAGAARRAEDIPYISDLARDAEVSRTRQIPILVLFKAQDCAYCERVRRDFLLPLQRNPEYAGKVILRQIYRDGKGRIVDFSGKTVTPAQFTGQQGVKFSPTVKLLDADGRTLAEPLIGLTTPDFYGAYLDRAIDEALGKLRNPPQP